jgi:UMF1 family MFS transporter
MEWIQVEAGTLGSRRLATEQARPLPPATRREIVAWAMFDFANSSYTTIVVTFFFSLVFTKLIAAGPAADLWWGRAITVSNVTVLLLSPLMGAIADESGRKKSFLFATYLLCVGSTAALWLVEPGQVPLAFALFVVSNVAFSFGENFAGAFLPEISTPQNIGKISGFGWGLGYFGGLLSLACAFPLAKAGIEMANYERLRLIWPVTALFFLLAGLPTFLILRERAPRRSEPLSFYFANGFGRLATTLRSAATFRELVRFLAVFFVYSMGLMSTIAFFGVYADKTLKFTVIELFLLGALLQIPSALGAFAFGLVQDKLGAQRTLQIALALWIFVSATVATATEKRTFWAIAMLAGLGIGSVQASSRALVGAFSPVGKSGEFFGLWGLAGKAAYACGPLIFGWVSAVTGSQRVSVWVNGVFFLVGLVALFAVDERRGREAAARWNAASDPLAAAPGR